jgi:putative component of membrane protein insertase Oxa1/YidC/SpoIIIJ protein YidD
MKEFLTASSSDHHCHLRLWQAVLCILIRERCKWQLVCGDFQFQQLEFDKL